MFTYSNPFERLLPYSHPLPKEIHKRITRSNGELIFMARRINDGTLIPILNEAYEEYNERTGSRSFPFFDRYSKGVIQGKNFPFIPHIDTPENRKELVLNMVNQEIYLVPDIKLDDEDDSSHMLSEYMYYYGIEVGKLYKAWCIIVQNPKYFLDAFKAYEKEKVLKNKEMKGTDPYSKFEDLFYDKNLIKPCIDILSNIDPPARDFNNNYIGGLKSVLVVWYEELLRAKSKIVKPVNDSVLAHLLNNKFPGLDIARSTISEYSPRVEKYRMDIKVLVSNMDQP